MPTIAGITVGFEERTNNSMLATASGLTTSASFDEDTVVDKLHEYAVNIDARKPNTATCFVEGRFKEAFGINVVIKVPVVRRGIPLGQGGWHNNYGHDYLVSIHWDGIVHPDMEFLVRLDQVHVHRRCIQTAGGAGIFMNYRIIHNHEDQKVIEAYIYSRSWNFHPYRMCFADGDANYEAVWAKIDEHINRSMETETDLSSSMAGHCCIVLNSGLRQIDLTPYHTGAGIGQVTVVVEKCVRKREDDQEVDLLENEPPVASFKFLYRSHKGLKALGLLHDTEVPKAGSKRPRKTVPKIHPGDDEIVSVAEAMNNFVNDNYPDDAKKPAMVKKQTVLKLDDPPKKKKKEAAQQAAMQQEAAQQAAMQQEAMQQEAMQQEAMQQEPVRQESVVRRQVVVRTEIIVKHEIFIITTMEED